MGDRARGCEAEGIHVAVLWFLDAVDLLAVVEYAYGCEIVRAPWF